MQFDVRGTYRTQSHKDPAYSALTGRLAPEVCPWLSTVDVQAALERDPLWRGRARIETAPARVDSRAGRFAQCADALYYESNFVAAVGSSSLPANIIDVDKLTSHWRRRSPHVARVLDRTARELLETLVGAVAETACAEYTCHEAGHSLGWPIGEKLESCYFRLGAPTGRVAWPLVFAEEFRADLLGLRVARRILAPERALAIFAYQTLHRIGLAAERAYGAGEPEGLVPYLLVDALLQSGTMARDGGPGQRRLTLTSCDPHQLLERVDALIQAGFDALATVENTASVAPIDVAINAAAYVRRRMTDAAAQAHYTALLSSP